MESSLYISEQFDPKNKKQVVTLQILGSVQFSATFRKWFKSDSLQENEKIIGIAMCHASLGEAIHLFHSSVHSGVISKNETWDKSTKNDWDYLFSEEANAIKREVLKYIRDKTAFHVDPETIKNFMEIEKDKKHKLGLFQIPSEGEGYSPMITSILSYKLFERLLSDGEERLVNKEIPR
ncbi:hypothetical protein [Fictibacillus sp. NRS-1165]|uniref:hypothetical protein n=1 Tax=Fictibacillus sp. NRS-1165 TaxID=3144463 RepID=UPI003D1BF545